MIDAGTYILGAAALVAVVASLAFSAHHLRARLLPAWEGAPARLVEAIVGIALLIWLSQILGTFDLFYAWPLIVASLLLAGGIASASVREGRPGGSGRVRRPVFRPGHSAREADSPAKNPALDQTPPASPSGMTVVAIAVVALVFAHWGLTTADALDRGIFNFDSLWYHMPFAVEMAQSHSVTGLHYTDTVFTNWFYPQNSELLHAVGILLTQRDTLSLFINFGFLALAFLAAWCIGRPYGRAPLGVVAVAIVLEAHTLVVREPGAAKNDIVTAALLLAAVAILVNAWNARPDEPPRKRSAVGFPQITGKTNSGTTGWVGWPLAAAGLAVGLAAGTKFTVMAMAAALSLAVIVLAPAGRRWAAAAWWFLPALAGGGFWYLRNLVAIGNPLPQMESLGPLSLPHPERLQTARPDFSVAHYATDTAVWSDYFGPGLDHAFGALWPLVIGAAVAGALLATLRPPGHRPLDQPPGATQKSGNRWSLRFTGDRVVRWMGGVALFGMVAYLFTPLSAAGAEGEPVAFAINVRYAIPVLLVGLALLPLAFGRGAWSWALLGALLGTLVLTNRSDAVLRDPDRLFAIVFATLVILIPVGIAWSYIVLSRRTRHVGQKAAGRTIPADVAGASSAGGRGGGGSRTTPPAGPPSPLDRARGATPSFLALSLPSFVAFAVVALVFTILAIGYPLQRDYLDDRFRNANPARAIPGMGLDSAYRWARGVEDARIGLAGTTAGFLQYGFYGTDLSNRVRYLGARGPHGSFNAIPDCRAFRAAVNAADLDYLVTAPFLNFIRPDRPVPSPEAGWLRGDRAVAPILPRSAVGYPRYTGITNSGTGVVVWRVRGRLDPAACGPANAPLRRIPNAPKA